MFLFYMTFISLISLITLLIRGKSHASHSHPCLRNFCGEQILKSYVLMHPDFRTPSKLMTMTWPKGCTYLQMLYLNCDFRNHLKTHVQQHHTLLSSPCPGSEGEGLGKGKLRQAGGTELLHLCSEKLGSRTPENTVWHTWPLLKHSWGLHLSKKICT